MYAELTLLESSHIQHTAKDTLVVVLKKPTRVCKADDTDDAEVLEEG
jgi:hypothetical protein